MRPTFVTPMTIAAALLLTMTSVAALMPYAKPEPAADVENGVPGPFAGAWSVTIPTMTMGERDTRLAICTLPVRIEAVGDAQIIYRQPRETRTGTQFDLQPQDDGTLWTPIEGDQPYFAFWVSADGFFLYDQIPKTEADWGRPMIYSRCP